MRAELGDCGRNRRAGRAQPRTKVFLALPQLGRLFGLSAFEREASSSAWRPELRRKYDRLYAYLQDDITRKRPSVDLISSSVRHRGAAWEARRLAVETARLLRAGILQKIDDPHSPSGSSGLAQFLALDPRICRVPAGRQRHGCAAGGVGQLHQPARWRGPVAGYRACRTACCELGRAPSGADHARTAQAGLFTCTVRTASASGTWRRSVCGRLGVLLARIWTPRRCFPRGPTAEALLRTGFSRGAAAAGGRLRRRCRRAAAGRRHGRC